MYKHTCIPTYLPTYVHTHTPACATMTFRSLWAVVRDGNNAMPKASYIEMNIKFHYLIAQPPVSMVIICFTAPVPPPKA